MAAARTKEATTSKSNSTNLPNDKKFFVGYTLATFIGVLLAIATMKFISPEGSSSHALAPYIGGFCSKYGGPVDHLDRPGRSRTDGNDSDLINISYTASHKDRIDALELKVEELALAIKTLAENGVVISSRLDSELAGIGRSLEDLGDRLHRVENHVIVSEDLS